MELEKFRYDNEIVRMFLFATMLWGVVGILVGVIIAFAVSPDGRWIVTLDTGGISRLWAIQPEDLIAQACTRLRKPRP